MTVWIHVLLIAIVGFVGTCERAFAEKRVALIVANGAYANVPLNNPVVDADIVDRTLKSVGFVTKVVKDADLETFDREVTEFDKTANEADVALFYFAGHGFSVNEGGRSVSVLMSTSANVTSKSDAVLRSGGLRLDEIVKGISARARVTLAFVDACRNDPRKPDGAGRGTGDDIGRGFKAADKIPNANVFIGMSTRLDHLARDGVAGQGSPFARAFEMTMTVKGLRIEDAFSRLKTLVLHATDDEQSPETAQIDLPEGGVTLASLETGAANGAGAGGAGNFQTVQPEPAPPTCKLKLESDSVDADGVGHFVVTDSCSRLYFLSVTYLGWTFTQAPQSSSRAEFSFDFFSGPSDLVIAAPDGRSLPYAPAAFRSDGLMKAVVIWNGNADISLHAFENSAEPGSNDDVSPSNPRSLGDSMRLGAGYISEAGRATVDGWHVQVYSYRISGGLRSVEFRVNQARCDALNKKIKIYALRYVEGQLSNPDYKTAPVGVQAKQCGQVAGDDRDRWAPRVNDLDFKLNRRS